MTKKQSIVGSLALALCLLHHLPNVEASARYYAYAAGTLSLSQIGNGSVFEGDGPTDGIDLSKVVVTVDDTFLNPALPIQKTDVVEGAGIFTACADSTATLNAVDPFNLVRGDSLTIFARVSGLADHGEDFSFASSSTAISTKLRVINDTNQAIFVDTLWRTCESLDAEGFGWLGETAWAAHNTHPTLGESCWTSPVVFRFGPNSINDLRISAEATGYASVVPEPSPLVIWIVFGVASLCVSCCRSKHRMARDS